MGSTGAEAALARDEALAGLRVGQRVTSEAGPVLRIVLRTIQIRTVWSRA